MDPRDARDLAPRECCVVAVAVTAVLAAWELAIDRVVNGAVSRALGPLARTLLLDAALWLPLAVFALLAAKVVCRRGVSSKASSAGIAAVAALAFGALLVPVAIVRQKALATGIPTLAGDSVDAVGGAISASAWLCSAIGSSRGAETGIGSAVAASARTALLLEAAAFPAFWAAIALARRGEGSRFLAMAAAAIAAIVVDGTMVAAARAREDDGPSVSAAPGCLPDHPVRSYAVSAIDVDIPLNRWGGHVPGASMYVLDSRLPAVRAQERAPLPDRVSIGLRGDPIQPLVLRANSGDCLVVNFTNRAREGNAAFHVHGLPSAATRAGAPALGDARARPGETVTYAFQVPSGPLSERTYLVQDVGDPARGVQGLFGAIVIEPEGSVYRDPETGGPLERSSWDAIIHVRDGHDFREFVLVYHQLANALAVNYRSEDFRSRFEAGGVDEANAYSSYEYGDPATPILRSYLGERTVLRVAHGAGDAYYVHHLHGNSILWRQASRVRPSAVAFGWLEQPMLPRAPPPEKSSGRSAGAAGSDDEEPEHMWVQIDALTFSPGQTHDARIACGAGGCQRAAGDFLYHSHVPQHAERGMWGVWRVFDTFQDDLPPLPDAEVPPRAVTSAGLLGRVIEGKKVVRAGHLRDPAAEQSIDDLVESQLPPRGERLDARDATVWDWRRIDMPEGPVYLGEPDTTDDWANFRSPYPGRRLPILFNPTTGRYAWPPFRPHLGKRPPFSARHTAAPWLGEVATSVRPDGVCPATELLHGPDRKTRVFSVAARRGDVLGASSSVSYDTHGKPRLIERRRADNQRYPVVLVAHVGQCMDVLFVNDGAGERRRIDVHAHDVWGDPQASDGIAAGFSYAQQVEAYRDSQRVVTRAVEPGATMLELSNTTRLRPGIWVGIGLGEGFCAGAEGAPDPRSGPPRDADPCTEIRRIAAVDGTKVVLDSPLRFAHAAGQFVDVEFLRFQWFVPSRLPEVVTARTAARAVPPPR
ncbi:MAG: multicopper oxidase domain-containing protein [Myxococcales bacterium]